MIYRIHLLIDMCKHYLTRINLSKLFYVQCLYIWMRLYLKASVSDTPWKCSIWLVWLFIPQIPDHQNRIKRKLNKKLPTEDAQSRKSDIFSKLCVCVTHVLSEPHHNTLHYFLSLCFFFVLSILFLFLILKEDLWLLDICITLE